MVVPISNPVVLGRYELPGNLASIAALAAAGQVTILPHELIRTTDGRVYHWTGTSLEVVSAPVHHGTVADVAALDGIYLLPSCTRGVHSGDTAYVSASGCEYRVTAGVNATATWSSCATIPPIPTTPAEVGADPSGTAATAVSAHNTANDSHADIRTLIDGRALNVHQHARADLPWINDPGAALIAAETVDAQRTALGMTAWAVAPWTDGTTSDIPEGTQLYFTNARADARIAAQKGQAEGLATLDAGGKLPTANLPDSIVGQVVYKGLWDASTNTPTLPTASAAQGYYYITSFAGVYAGIAFDVGDWCISNGESWGKVDNSDAITSFAGRTGAILPISSDYSAHYLGLHAPADDSAKLGGVAASEYVRTATNAVFASLAVRVPGGGAGHALLLETSSDGPWNTVISRSDLVSKNWRTFLASDGSYRFYNDASALVFELRQDGTAKFGMYGSGVLVSTGGVLSTAAGFTGAKVIGGTTLNFVNGLLVS